MDRPLNWLAVGLGAACGAWLRWGLAVWLTRLHAHVNVGTAVANLGGGYLIGLALGYFTAHPHLAPAWRLFVITGFLGGLTTFSTFSGESMKLLEGGAYGWALVHVLLHVAGALACCFAGMASWRALAA